MEYVAPGWDIVGDVHGCFEELWELLGLLNYGRILTVDGSNPGGRWFTAEHPEGRKLAFVGDYTDRGPASVSCLQFVRQLTMDGHVAARGNHDDKLGRALRKEPTTTKGTPMRMSHGLKATMKEMQLLTLKDRAVLTEWLNALPHIIKLRVADQPDYPTIVVSHAGVPFDAVDAELTGPIKAQSIYGEVTGKDEWGYPIRGHEWRKTWTPEGNRLCVFGHTMTEEPDERGMTVNIDTGCVFGGKLTALRLPASTYVQVNAEKIYFERHAPEP